jgi:hypothetical protein
MNYWHFMFKKLFLKRFDSWDDSLDRRYLRMGVLVDKILLHIDHKKRAFFAVDVYRAILPKR